MTNDVVEDEPLKKLIRIVHDGFKDAAGQEMDSGKAHIFYIYDNDEFVSNLLLLHFHLHLIFP
jgi:hypothetical protein